MLLLSKNIINWQNLSKNEFLVQNLGENKLYLHPEIVQVNNHW